MNTPVTPHQPAMLSSGGQAFLSIVKNAWRFKLFMLAKLPAAYFSGVRVRSISADQATVAVPYTWFSQNPFRSTYFACLSMAAEMSTGLLAMMHVHERKPAVSMLVVGLEASFQKKATGVTAFTCTDGGMIAHAVEEAVATGEGRQVKTQSTGYNESGEVVAVFHITWSFRAKKS
jgi:hypothetical protein